MDQHASARRVTRRARRTIARSGFTLVELAVVVTIVGVLAVIAVVGYRRYVLSSKISEAQAMISAIRIAQEDHKAERGTYANLGEATFCPVLGGKASTKAAWTPSCSGGTADWTTLPVHADGPVHFAYATVAGNAAFTAPTAAAWINWGTPAPNPWYVIMARCDLDGDASTTTDLVGSSFQNTIFSRNEGM